MAVVYVPEERCVMCGDIIPEGSQVCAACYANTMRPQIPSKQPVPAPVRKSWKSALLRLLRHK